MKRVQTKLTHAPPMEQRLMIHTGLSVTVVGHLLYLERDEGRKVATVKVKLLDGHVTTGMEGSAIKVAADLLEQRARRFYGIGWTVVGLANGLPSSPMGVSA